MDSIDIALFLAYALTILAVVGAIAFPIFNAISDPKQLIKSGIGVGALLVVFLVSWAISGAEVTELYIEKEVGADLSKLVGGMLTMMYVLTLGAIGGIVYTEVSKTIK
ncbi:MAG: hypothetical protein JXR07_05535 [Reichenbachiella sp.]